MKSLLPFFLACWSLLAAAQQAGRIELADGVVWIYDAAKNARQPKIGEAINAGESVVTGGDGELHLAMEDGGQIAVRPNTRMRIEKYRAEGAADDRSVIGLFQGALRSVTGWIGKYSARNYQIRTPTATIGVRGTDHETHVIPPDSEEGEAGTYDKVNVGSTLLTTPQGATEIHPNQAGFVPHFGKVRPALLPAVPGFFRPGRHEGRFADLHERVHRQLEQRRNERIRQLAERRAQIGSGGGQRRFGGAAENLRQREDHPRRMDERRQGRDMEAVREQRRELMERRRGENGEHSAGPQGRPHNPRRLPAEDAQVSTPEHRRLFDEGGGHRRP